MDNNEWVYSAIYAIAMLCAVLILYYLKIRRDSKARYRERKEEAAILSSKGNVFLMAMKKWELERNYRRYLGRERILGKIVDWIAGGSLIFLITTALYKAFTQFRLRLNCIFW